MQDTYKKMIREEHPLHTFRFCPVCGKDGFEENDWKSKRCPHCGFVYYHNPATATAALIENEAGELLVVRRAREPAKGTLDLPGGFCDCGETAEEGVVREIREETGLEAKVERFLFSLPNVYRYEGFDVHTLDLFFLCRVKCTKSAKASDDASETMWLPWSEIRAEAFGLTSIRKGIEQILTKKKHYK